MMNRRCFEILGSLLVLLLSASCGVSPEGYTVSGVLPDSTADGKTIYIVRHDDWKYMDTTVVEGNKFFFEGVAEEPVYCRITVKPGVSAGIVLENGRVELDFTKSKYPTGTANNDELARINRMEDNQLKEFSQGMRQAIKEKKRLKEYKEEYTQKLKKQAFELFASHKDDVIGYYLLYSSYMNILDEEECQEVIGSLGASLQQTSRVQYLQKQLNNQH